jgi:hypothetical protein
MCNKKPNTNVAKTIKTKQTNQRLNAELRTRPVSLAFLIREDIQEEHFIEIIEYLSTIWGGYYCCLIPTNGDEISNSWWDILYTYNPDIVIVCGDSSSQHNLISEEITKRINREIQPYKLEYWNTWDDLKKAIALHNGHAGDIFDNIPIVDILNFRLKQINRSGNNRKTNMIIPLIEKDNPRYLNIAVQVGIAREFYKTAYLNFLEAETVSISKENTLEEYLEFLEKFKGKFTPLKTTMLYTQGQFDLSPQNLFGGTRIILIGSNRIRDICVYWDLRLSINWYTQFSTSLLLSVSELRDPKNLSTLISSLQNGSWSSNEIHLITDSVTKKEIEDLKTYLSEHLTEKKISISKFEGIPNFSVFNTTVGDMTILEENTYQFRALKPEFEEFIANGEWSVDIKFQSPFEYPVFSSLNSLLCGSPSEEQVKWRRGYWSRYGNYQAVSFRVMKSMHFITGYLISPIDAYKSTLEDKGYKVLENDKQSCSTEFLNLLGSINLLEESNVRDFLWCLSKSKALPYSKIANILKLGDRNDEIIEDFILKKILFRGVSFTCESCGLDQWYPLGVVDDVMKCNGCSKLVRLPAKLEIKFVLNELVKKAVITHGTIPVLLAKGFLDRQSRGQKLSAYGIAIEKDKLKTDIDLITTYNGEMVICECKEYKDLIPPKEKGKAIKQLEGLVQVARDMNIEIILFCSLIPDTSPDFNELAKSILELNERNSDLRIHFLSLWKMGIVNLKDPQKIIDEPISLFNSSF